MPLLPVRPLPFPDEWLGSWLYRLAAENLPDQTPDPDRLLKALGITPSTQPLTDTQLATLAASTGKTFEELQILATTPPDLLRDNGSSGPTAVSVFLGVSHVLACARCLVKDAVPYLRRTWLSPSTVFCPIHGGPLLDHCPHCGARIGIFPAVRRPSYRRRPDIVRRTAADLRRCWTCQGDITANAGPLEHLLSGTETVPHAFDSRSIHDQQVWLTFVRALRRFLHTYHLDQLMGPGQVRLELVPSPLRPSPHTASSRFQAERILVWLLAPMATEVMHPHRRLQLTAGTVLGLLSATLTPDSAQRWLHIAWLCTRVLDDPASSTLNVWPTQVEALTDLFEKRRADPRDAPDPARKLDEQVWLVMSLLLDRAFATRPPRYRSGLFFTQQESRAALEALFRNLAGATWRDIEQTGLERSLARLRLESWRTDGRLGLALGTLHRELRLHRKHLLRPNRKEPAWVAPTVAVLLSDRCIELTRTVNPALHHVLLQELIQSLRLQVSA